MYVDIYIYRVQICIYTHISIYQYKTHLYPYIYIYMHVRMYACMYVCMLHFKLIYWNETSSYGRNTPDEISDGVAARAETLEGTRNQYSDDHGT